MPETIIPTASGRPETDRARAGALDRLARRVLLERIGRLRGARVTVVDEGVVRTLGLGDESAMRATITVNDRRFYRDTLLGGINTAAESFIAGRWTCDDLTMLVRIFARNMAEADGMKRGPARIAALAARGLHRLNRNTVTGSRRNIRAHYDLGNDFFELFLDETMTYSSAVFERPEMTLAEAQRCKYERICKRLELQADHHVVEIGAGWGGFAIHAAKRYGCRVTTTTISDRQFEVATARVRQQRLEDRVTVVKQDYRTLSGKFDRLVSIEMIEAVGAEFYPTYFAKCGALLKDDGVAVIQAITIADQRYERARQSVDFIKKFVFPGSCIPSVTAMCDAMTGASDLRLANLDDLTRHYATTLAQWRERLMARRDEAADLGYPDSLLRLWDFYLSYCEGGFTERAIGVVHMHLTKPDWREGT